MKVQVHVETRVGFSLSLSVWNRSRSGRSTGGSLVFGGDPGISTEMVNNSWSHGSRARLPGEDPISKWEPLSYVPNPSAASL